MGNHLSADLAETRKSVSDGEEAIFFKQRDIARRIPAVVKNLGCLLGPAEIALHHIWAFDEEHAGRSGRYRLTRIEIDYLNSDARQRMADLAPARADLAESGCAEVASVHSNDRRAFGAAIAFKRTD